MAHATDVWCATVNNDYILARVPSKNGYPSSLFLLLFFGLCVCVCVFVFLLYLIFPRLLNHGPGRMKAKVGGIKKHGNLSLISALLRYN